MKEKWLETRKSGDFDAIGRKFGIAPVIARIIRNREVIGEEAIAEYLSMDKKKLNNPHLMKDMDQAVQILSEKITQKKRIRIIGDYDIDGVNATYILMEGIMRCGGQTDAAIPDRMKDGYGINENLIQQAIEAGVDTIVTCDNGIAAIDEINYAKEQGLTVIVTDHHNIPYILEDEKKVYRSSNADAIINPKQEACGYPYKELCGAAVAWKFMIALYEKMGIPSEEADPFIENAAFATIGDVMDLDGENRMIVKLGLRALQNTSNQGLRALIIQNGITMEQLRAYHVGFVIGPCINASGRLDTAKRSLELLMTKTGEEAAAIATELIDLNDSRKNMTLQQLELAKEMILEEHLDEHRVLVVYLPECHESLAGIIAGRIRELYYKPVFVLTDSEEGVKGSGRSIEGYSMYDEMNKIADIFLKFGGHPMAAGLTISTDRVEEFRRRINEVCTMSEEELTPKVHIDAILPIEQVSPELVEQLTVLEPTGKGNTKPVFAAAGVRVISARIVGKNRNVLQMQLSLPGGGRMKAVHFGDVEAFEQFIEENYGREQLDCMMKGKPNEVQLKIIYDPSIDEYNGARNPQIIIRKYC